MKKKQIPSSLLLFVAYEKNKNDDKQGAQHHLHLVEQKTRRGQQVGGSSLSSGTNEVSIQKGR